MAEVVPISDKLREARERVLRAHLDAHNTGDVDAILATFARPRIELIPSNRVVEGEDEVRAYLEERRRSFPDHHVEVIALHHSDQSVISEHWMSATHLGDMHGVEPSGRRFRVRMAAFYDFDGDQIVNSRHYFDAGTIARQLA